MMDLQKIVEKFDSTTCIISVEKRTDGKTGSIRIEEANQRYLKAMEHVDENNKVIYSREFIPGSSSEKYMQKELNFENFC